MPLDAHKHKHTEKKLRAELGQRPHWGGVGTVENEDPTNSPCSRKAEVAKSAAGSQDPDRGMGIRV